MVPDTLTARSYRVALLFSGQPQMTREDNLTFYDNLTAQGISLPTFEQRNNEIILQSVTGGAQPSVLRISVGHFTDKFRLFILEDFPNKTMKIFHETADAAWKVFSDVWKESAQGLSLAEVTLRYTAVAEGGSATGFLLDRCLRVPKESLAALGRELNGMGIRLVSPVVVAPTQEPPLADADFDATIETLLEDPSRLYIQVTAKWPSLPLPAARKPVAGAEGMPAFLNPDCREPSWYLGQVESFTRNQIGGFLAKAGGKK